MVPCAFEIERSEKVLSKISEDYKETVIQINETCQSVHILFELTNGSSIVTIECILLFIFL